MLCVLSIDRGIADYFQTSNNSVQGLNVPGVHALAIAFPKERKQATLMDAALALRVKRVAEYWQSGDNLLREGAGTEVGA